MPRPRGRLKTARVTVNLEDHAYSVLQAIAVYEDAPIAQIARRAIMDFLAREETKLTQPALPLYGSSGPERKDNRR